MPENISMFAFLTHTHGLGSDVTGYITDNAGEKEFASGDPQKPQTFHLLENLQIVREGDRLGARCTFDGTRTDKLTRMGIFVE